ncbi:MAG: hypothetical protein E4H20_08380, partial [Spirochaetales bacterium]
MKQTRALGSRPTSGFLVLAAIIIIMLSPASASALDIGAELLFGNMNLPWAEDAPIADANYPADLWLYGARVSLSEELGENFSLETSYITDPVIRHIVRSVVAYESGIVRIAAGPVLGLFNTVGTPIKAGISVNMRIDVPGIIFVSARADSSMGAGLMAEGDYAQELAELEAGWYVFNAICSASLVTRKFYRVVAADQILADASNRYAFSVDIFKKSSPYRLLLSLGYQDLTRTYPDTTIDKLGLLFIGTRVNAQIDSRLSIVTELESGVYAFGLEALTGRGPDPNTFMFRVSAGIRLRLG